MDTLKTGRLIAQTRRAKSMTQRELAALLHVTDRAVSKWERGLSFPDVSLLEPLAQALGLTVTELLTGERTALTAPDNSPPLQETAAVPRRRSRGLKLTVILTGILAFLLLGVLFCCLRNASDRPGRRTAFRQIGLSQKEQTVAGLSGGNANRYRYTLTGDIKTVRAVYEVWTDSGMYESGILWERSAADAPLVHRGTFLLGLDLSHIGDGTPQISLRWLLPSMHVGDQSVSLPGNPSGTVMICTPKGSRLTEDRSAVLLLLSLKNESTVAAFEKEATYAFAESARPGAVPPVPSGGFSVVIRLEAEP